MTNYTPVVVPAIPPRPPQLTLLGSAIRPDDTSDPSSSAPGSEALAHLPADLRAELDERKGAMWTRGITYAPENHFAATVRDPCDNTTVDRPAIPAPLGLVATAHITGGTLAAATYTYEVTAVNGNGETTASTAVTATTTGSTGSVTLSGVETVDGATYNVYGRVGGSIGLIASGLGPFDPESPFTYTDTGTPAPGAAAPSSNTTGGAGSYANLATVTAIPYLIEVEDSCSSWGFEERDFKGRALRLLENATPQAIEHEFWTGMLAQAKGYPNNYLANAASYSDLTPGAGPPSIARGQQLLQDALATCGFGGQGMLHVQPQTTPNLLSVRRVGKLMLDEFDNIVIPGVGYTGVAAGVGTPAAGTAVMFATDLVRVLAEDAGTVFPDTFEEALDRGQAGQPNLIRFRAEKFGVAYFDAACHFAVRVTLAT